MKFLSILMIALLFNVIFAKGDTIKINLTCRIEPYTSNYDIEAEVWLNGDIIKTFPADNTGFIRIRGEFSKEINDKVKVTINVHKPMNYCCTRPLSVANSSIDGEVRIIPRDSLRKSGLGVVLKYGEERQYSRAIEYSEFYLDQKVYDDENELLLKKSIAENCIASKNFDKGLEILGSVSIRSLNKITETDKADYYKKYLLCFYKGETPQVTSELLAKKIYSEKDLNKNWGVFISKLSQTSQLEESPIFNDYKFYSKVYSVFNTSAKDSIKATKLIGKQLDVLSVLVK